MGQAKDATDALGRAMYELIATSDGLTAREIARELGAERREVNRRLYTYPFTADLCYADECHRWHALIRQEFPHRGLFEFSGLYATVAEFMATSEDEWLAELKAGCARIGRSLSDTRGLIHSFLDCRAVMRDTFEALLDFGVACQDWEIVFELRIRRARWVRIYADVLVVTPKRAFSLEFKMKAEISPEEVAQAAKYVPYLEVIFGSAVDVVCALVLTRAHDLFEATSLPGTDAEILVASGDALFNVFDAYLGFLDT